MMKLIIKTIQEFVEIDENEINKSTHFVKDLHLTSYDVVSIIGILEDNLSIEIPDREIKNLETIGELMEYINKSYHDIQSITSKE